MNSNGQFLTLYSYHFDTTYRLIALVEALPATSYPSPEDGAPSTVDMLYHILDTGRGWRIALETGRRPERLRREDYADLAALKRGFEQEQAAWEAFLTGLDEDQIGGEIELQAGPDRVFRFGRWQVLYHVVLHGMQHHAEIAALLTDQGLSPGDIDFIFYALGR
ncbi:MAG: DinB family protein [Anaerolineae bacterium]|jgi:uncharacterized damage-inducible protein DinB